MQEVEMRSSKVWMLTGVLLITSGCGVLDKKSAGTPMAELIKGGMAPVEVSGLSRSIGPVPAFQATLRNLSDKPIQAVKWTAIHSSTDGVPLQGGPSEGGFGEFGGIKPGAAMKGVFGAPEGAATVKIVLKEVIYEEQIKEFKIDKIWRNPRHDSEVQQAMGASVVPAKKKS
jgi:hypothetical protein